MLIYILIILPVLSAPQSPTLLPPLPQTSNLQTGRMGMICGQGGAATFPSVSSSKWGQLCKQAARWRITDRSNSLHILRKWYTLFLWSHWKQGEREKELEPLSDWGRRWRTHWRMFVYSCVGVVCSLLDREKCKEWKRQTGGRGHNPQRCSDVISAVRSAGRCFLALLQSQTSCLPLLYAKLS